MVQDLSDALPAAEFVEHHAAVLPVSPRQVWPALLDLAWDDLRWTRPLVAVRGLGGHEDRPGRLFESGPVRMLRLQPERYVAAGRISRPWQWRPDRGPEVTTLDALATFAEPGWLKLGLEFRLAPLLGCRTRLETATLCEPTDAAARDAFAPYWRLIRPFSGLIRRDLLAAVRRGCTAA